MNGDGGLDGHIVVFGCRGVGRRIVKQLSVTLPRVLVVDPEASAADKAELERWDVDYLVGSGQSVEILREAQVSRALAVICATNDDLRNIEIALLVREMSATVRIVVQMANSSVGQALQPVTRPGAVLDVAALASTSFVEAALDKTTHSLLLGGQEFIVASFRAAVGGTFRSLWGDMAPIALVPADGEPTMACPARDQAVSPGDLVTLLGTARDYQEVGLEPQIATAPVHARPLRRRLRESLAALNDAVDRPFRIAAAVLIVLATVSVAVLMYGYREPDGTAMDLLDAVYFTSETVATVGFGDFYFRDQAAWLRLWAIVIVLFGATLITVATALLTNALVSRSLSRSLGRQRLTGMSGHIVVIGLGSVGSKVAIELRQAGYDVAIVDGGEGTRFIPQMEAAGMHVLIGDATLPETQRAAGVHRAAGVAVLTSDDLANIETGLAVRGLVGDRPVPIALRVFGRSLARVIGNGLDAGVPRSIAELAAPWFIGAALGMEVLGTFYVGSAPFMAARLRIRAGSGLEGVTVDDLRISARVVAVQRADAEQRLEQPVHRDVVLNTGDSAFLVGHYEELLRILHRG